MPGWLHESKWKEGWLRPVFFSFSYHRFESNALEVLKNNLVTLACTGWLLPPSRSLLSSSKTGTRFCLSIPLALCHHMHLHLAGLDELRAVLKDLKEVRINGEIPRIEIDDTAAAAHVARSVAGERFGQGGRRCFRRLKNPAPHSVSRYRFNMEFHGTIN